METVKKNLFVPVSHKLRIEVALPESFPIGEAEVILVFASKNEAQLQKNHHNLLKLAGTLKGSSHFHDDPLTLQKTLRNEWPN